VTPTACGILAAMPEELDQTARQTLALETTWWRYAETKEAAIRFRFGEDPSTYYRRLGRLVDDPAAMRHAPVLVRRLRRQRARRLNSRSGRRLAG
jgi:hypothetical protein